MDIAGLYMPKAGIASAIPAFGVSVILLISGGDALDTVALLK